MTTIRINKELLAKAQQYGINLSRTVENLLKIYLEGIEQVQNQIRQQTNKDFSLSEGSLFKKEKVQWTGRDLNPRPPDCESKTYGSGDSLNVDWSAFKEWLLKTHKPYVTQYMVSYAQKFQSCLTSGDLSVLLELSPGKKRLVMSSLSALAKYLGVYEDWRRLIRQYGLKWSGKSKDEIFIERLTKVKNPNEVFEWIKRVKEERPDLAEFMDLMVISGMRLVEAVESYNLIIKLASEGKLNKYYNEEKGTLEHFHFTDKFLRKGKKTFVSFVPKDLVQRITEKEKLNKYSIQTAIKRKGLPLRFGDIRELHGTLLTKTHSESEINFLHGRVGTGVFMQNYFNPVWITDLKQRTFKAIAEIKERIT